MKSASQAVDQMFSLAAAAFTEIDREKRREHLRAALKIGCEFMMRLNTEIDGYIAQLLEQADVNISGDVAVRLEVAAQAGTMLEVFRNRQALRAFMSASASVLEANGLDPTKIRELSTHVEQHYEDVVAQRLSVEHLSAQFIRLQRFFCRPPPGGSAAANPKEPSGGPGGAAESWEEKISRRIQTVCAILGLFLPFFTGGAVPPALPPGLSVPKANALTEEQLVQLRLLGVLLIAALAGEMENRGEIPPQKNPLRTAPSDSRKKLEDRELVAHA